MLGVKNLISQIAILVTLLFGGLKIILIWLLTVGNVRQTI